MSSPAITELTVKANGIALSCLAAGPEEGRLVLCLHGFPDTAHTWRYLLPELAAAGFGPLPHGCAATHLPVRLPMGSTKPGALASDAGSLHTALGGDERAVVIGHDWGAMAACGAAARWPDRWARVVAVAVPPTPALATRFFSCEQLHRSWYMFFFQSPPGRDGGQYERPQVHRPSVG
jgi:pimeloyl-ACP methyl ester carboxylesterase